MNNLIIMKIMIYLITKMMMMLIIYLIIKMIIIKQILKKNYFIISMIKTLTLLLWIIFLKKGSDIQ